MLRFSSAYLQGLCRSCSLTGQTSPTGERLECDEFPPASTTEGGTGASRLCIPASQNSKLQGPLINCYIEFYGLQAGQQFVVRMNSCATSPSRLRARDTPDDDPSVQANGDGTLTLSSTAAQWIANPNTVGGGGNGTGFVVIPLANVTQGSYTASLNFSSLDGFQDLAVVDGDGFRYWGLGDTLDSPSFNPVFDVSEDDADLVVAAAASSSVSVSATLVAHVQPSATTSASAARALAPVGSQVGSGAMGVLVVLGVLAGGLAVLL